MTNDPAKEYGNNPVELFQKWLAEATQSEPNDPEAFCLATVNADGQPAARMLLLKDISENGFKFHTHEDSRKGNDIASNAKVEMCFYWKSTRKQVRIRGRAEQVSDAESDAYFKTRPPARQVGAWASKQSQPLESPEALNKSIESFEKKFSGTEIPRPPGWKGYRVIPESIEFWIGEQHRLHTRFIYIRNHSNWHTRWLFP